ncbi:hypothetical protein [Microbacterium gorillae]|uniref:hypothetical protein n=1 Tax=Microbacterium gorillae TaxID=1231063 RepID=UPI003D9834BC
MNEPDEATPQVISEWELKRGHAFAESRHLREARRYRVEVYGLHASDSRDRILTYRTLLMARINAWIARCIGADRIVIVDTTPELHRRPPA